MMETVLLFATILAPIVVALVELTKTTVSYPKNYVPAVAVLIGLIIGVLAAPFTDLDVAMRLWAGGFAGLAATGLFEIGNKREGLTK